VLRRREPTRASPGRPLGRGPAAAPGAQGRPAPPERAPPPAAAAAPRPEPALRAGAAARPPGAVSPNVDNQWRRAPTTLRQRGSRAVNARTREFVERSFIPPPNGNL